MRNAPPLLAVRPAGFRGPTRFALQIAAASRVGPAERVRAAPEEATDVDEGKERGIRVRHRPRIPTAGDPNDTAA